MQKRILSLLLAWCVLVGAALPKMVFAAGLPYFLEVNLTQNVVTVYGQDAQGQYVKPVKSFLCSVGSSTPTGTFQTSDKYVWRALYGDVYGQYATRITGDILFHSVPYLRMYDKGSLQYQEYNLLGQSVSMGCVRLTVEDAKWIYDHCPSGTSVRIVHSDAKLPLTPKKTEIIDANQLDTRGWDPTDPDASNPWHAILAQRIPSPETVTICCDGKCMEVQALNHHGSYHLRRKDAKKVFDQLDQKPVLPIAIVNMNKQENVVQVKKGDQVWKIRYLIYENEVYYQLRDLADQTGSNIMWDDAKGEILLTAPVVKEEKPSLYKRICMKLGFQEDGKKPDPIGWLMLRLGLVETLEEVPQEEEQASDQEVKEKKGFLERLSEWIYQWTEREE